jgi:hypothetical protein
MSGIDKSNSSTTTPAPATKSVGQGRGPRSRRNVAELASAILARDVRKISLMVTKAALDGDMAAAKLVLGLLIPVPKDRTVKFDLGPITNASDGDQALSAVLAAVAAGKLTPSEGDKLAGIIKHKSETSHMAEVERRLSELEAAGNARTITYRKVGN